MSVAPLTQSFTFVIAGYPQPRWRGCDSSNLHFSAASSSHATETNKKCRLQSLKKNEREIVSESLRCA